MFGCAACLLKKVLDAADRGRVGVGGPLLIEGQA